MNNAYQSPCQSHTHHGEGRVNDAVSHLPKLRYAPIIAELRTNIVVGDEFALTADLTFHLATRYNQPDTTIMIRVHHSACLALGGNFDPCYILTITTAPHLLGSTANKQNAPFIQLLLADVLKVESRRGFILFHHASEDNIAVNGTTLSGEANDLRTCQLPGARHAQQIMAVSTRLGASSAPRNIAGKNLQIPSQSRAQPMRPQYGSKDLLSTSLTLPDSSVFELPAFEIDQGRPRSALNAPASGISEGQVVANISNAHTRTKSLSDTQPKAFNGNVKTLQNPPVDQAHPVQDISSFPSIPIRPSSPPRPSTCQSKTNTTQVPHSSLKKAHDSFCKSFFGPPVTPAVSSPLDPPSLPPLSALFLDINHGRMPSASNTHDNIDVPLNYPDILSAQRATPKIPEPPPIPDSASRSVRLPKRKTFLSAFRGSSGRGSI